MFSHRLFADSECWAGTEYCKNDYLAKASTLNNYDPLCGMLEDLSECMLDIDECDKDYIYQKILPRYYNESRMMGVHCAAEDMSMATRVPPHLDCGSATDVCTAEFYAAASQLTSWDPFCGLKKKKEIIAARAISLERGENS
ncbi:hypothetical protein ElyMa_001894500 [Elysia marginata]|uniref:GDNF/GAS1 domain-containing protein n=1 Tax=Elysia marginata TaxID=1093978 RepID=A0AAV4ER23_9GAST|nr:hypothetical protein ElyMa_001894500 [Elysia marginata]